MSADTYVINGSIQSVNRAILSFFPGYGLRGGFTHRLQTIDDQRSRVYVSNDRSGPFGGIEIQDLGNQVRLRPVPPPLPDEDAIRRYAAQPGADPRRASQDVYNDRLEAHDLFIESLFHSLRTQGLVPLNESALAQIGRSEQWPETLRIWASSSPPPWPWVVVISLPFDQVDDAFERLLLPRVTNSPIEDQPWAQRDDLPEGLAVRLRLTCKRESRSQDPPYRITSERVDIGRVALDWVDERYTRLEVTSTGEYDRALKGILTKFIQSWLAEPPPLESISQKTAVINAPEKEESRMDPRQYLQQLQQNGRKFLLKLAEKANFNASDFVTMKEVVDEMDLSEEEAYRVEDYLQGKEWLRRETFGGLDGSLRMTPAGIAQVERWLETGDEIGALKPPAIQGNEPLPWELIPDNSWDRVAVEMLHQGYTDPEIAERLFISPKRVTNRLSDLRRLFPDQVPTRDELRRRGRKSG